MLKIVKGKKEGNHEGWGEGLGWRFCEVKPDGSSESKG